MSFNSKIIGAGVLFFLGQGLAMGQKTKSDSTKVTKIEDVVLTVAYGKQKKEAIVGAISSVDSKVLKTQQATNVATALQGSTAGVNIYTTSGQPGASPQIYIRGVGSISASSYPLIILDGVPYNGNLNNISQDQIESMNVLKDAASSAVYGSRAANGVIVITTKNGKLNGKPTFNFTSLVGVSSRAVRLHKLLGAEDYVKYTWQALRNKKLYTVNNLLNIDANGNLVAGDLAEANTFASNELIKYLGYNPYNVDRPIDENGNLVNGAKLLWDTDWEKELFNKAAFKQEYRFDMSGGSSNTRYFFAADYLKMDGVVKTSDFERTGLRMNIDSKLNNWLNAGMRSSFSATTANVPPQSGTNGVTEWIYLMPNIYPAYQMKNGEIAKDDFGNPMFDYGDGLGVNGNNINGKRPTSARATFNILGDLHYNNYIRKEYNVIGNGYLEAVFNPYLSFKSQLGYEFSVYDYFSYGNNLYGYTGTKDIKGEISQTRNLNKTINFTNSLNYNRRFGEHNLTGQGIFEVYQYTYEPFNATGRGFSTGVTALDAATKKTELGGNLWRERLVSYLGRLSYNYSNKYFLEGSFRTDGSSRFAEGIRWGKFFSTGASWVVTRENFFKPNKYINNLKLRASYGELGNSNTSDYFPYMMIYNSGYPQLDAVGILQGNSVDRNLSWEKTASVNAGADFTLFNRRINGSIEYFEKRSIDLIYSVPLPESTGTSSITTNMGSIKNYGWELTLNSTNIKTDDFLWTTNFNISTVKNRILQLSQEKVLGSTKLWEVGRSMYDFFLPEWAGVNPKTGQGQWYINEYNTDGSRKITSDYNIANLEQNRSYVGTSMPKFTGGLTNYFKYKNFDLNLLLNFSFGSKVYDSTYNGLMSNLVDQSQQSADVKKAWQNPGDITDVPMNIATISYTLNSSTSTRFLFNNDYIRLKSITLGYNISPETLETIGAKSLRLFFQADNIFTWQSHKGIDPEQGISGITGNYSPLMKTLSVGFTLGF